VTGGTSCCCCAEATHTSSPRNSVFTARMLH
jgi:hypothetical protein